ncbi:hypothetical protein GTA62_19670 [Roseobacter sp. HKCCD9010]|uniref:hypothetical protein n=1 Tax=unclassified Roseobacter TaxID=196798 RepID=UPI0014918740|nr:MULTISPECIES: hypothetical protein [unclassified Roseobacter]MBF9052183.1 hypothetical protein [Rhodobacterales bacterium HKCCD4356]NNV14138.1 hypothetical protein [Roseobacter sp. HKCCD7357]NNV18362.1 hypothetical protein [Roseobacter sp. HKCCD8768]NNV27802.1 hypothetical protein [Roseobacter sp. HKCCD8192]NNV32094.1 hypothetical protein [Roseobacter sp. HKCCD9061]
MSDTFTKVLGCASYRAHWVQRSNLVRLTATGVLPCLNYMAQLEQRAERVIPPNWNMVFYVEDYCQRALQPFSVSVVMTNSSGADAILV